MENDSANTDLSVQNLNSDASNCFNSGSKYTLHIIRYTILFLIGFLVLLILMKIKSKIKEIFVKKHVIADYRDLNELSITIRRIFGILESHINDYLKISEQLKNESNNAEFLTRKANALNNIKLLVENINCKNILPNIEFHHRDTLLTAKRILKDNNIIIKK